MQIAIFKIIALIAMQIAIYSNYDDIAITVEFIKVFQ